MAVLLLVFGLVLASPRAVLADEEESDRASVLVLQSVALIANGAPVDAVIERVEDALAAPDKSGTDLAQVERALRVIQGTPGGAGLDRAQELLVDAVDIRFATGYGDVPRPGEVSHGEPPYATGAETGMTAVLDDFSPARGISDGGDVVLLVLAAVSIGVGSILAHRWRPPDSIRRLRRDVALSEGSR